jgi:hypothetical protein
LFRPEGRREWPEERKFGNETKSFIALSSCSLSAI